ncbi:uncharacterized protein yc1106_04166 [Curvularia clavata]|uniref:Uncharacterized protein n=1 Tax=Curvularia clavata TaxID=95742 RepID=A0A9Q8Z770_CURCL|nr:uncharacterized protein yc1106_04166 [Curvularia clavata]
MASTMMPNPIRMDLLYRLRWNLLTDVHNTEIVLGIENEETIVPLFDHALADADLGVPSLSHIEVNSRECLEKFYLSYDSDGDLEMGGYRPPPPLIIKNEDGRSITLRQFVTEVHAYLNEHLEEVKKAQWVRAAEPWSENLLFFRRAFPRRDDDGNIIVNVEMMGHAADAETRDKMWAHQLRTAREGQHPLTRKRPGALPAQPDLIASPWRGSIAAVGCTGLLALVGRSRPGTFLRCAAFFSTVDLTYTAAELYGRREVNRGVFKMDKITPEPGKLWERSKHWTTEDATLAGGGLGVLMALNPRALPGAHGFSRFFGAATVGCALGYQVGHSFLVRINPRLLDLLDSSDKAIRVSLYERLRNNDEAKSSLSVAGKFALKYYTSPYLRILRDPLHLGRTGEAGGMASGRQRAHPSRSSPHSPALESSLQADANKFALIQVEFKSKDLAGPDMEAGYRAYRDDFQSRDESSIRDWLERIQSLKKQTGTELHVLWKELALKEHEFYLQHDETREKDVFRRELQLLNNMTSDLVARYAILEYYEADANKQLQQMRQTDSIPPAPVIAHEATQHSEVAAQNEYRGPQIVAELVRLNWSRQKEVLYHLEHTISQYEALPTEGMGASEQIKQVKQNAEDLRRNIEATERLLRWFETEIRKADEQVTK